MSLSLSNALAVKAEVSFFKLEALQVQPKKIKGKYKLDGNYSGATLNFALVALSETTKINRGENGGITLTNENIVRQLITKKASVNGEVSFAASPVPVVNNAAVIVFIQQQ